MYAFQKHLTRRFYALLSLPSTAMGFALSVQISALSWLLTTQFNLDIHDVGLVWAAGPIAGVIGQVLIGIISDNVWLWRGRRRPFIVIGGILASLSLLALPNIDIISSSLGLTGVLGVAIAVALSLDLSINVSFNPTRSVIADVTPPGQQRTKAYSWMQTVSGTFGVLAYVIGAFWNNFALIYLGAALVFVLSVFPPLLIEEPRQLPGSDGNTSGKLGLWEGFKVIQPLWGFLIYSVYALTARFVHYEPGHYWIEAACLLLTLALMTRVLFTPQTRGADGTSLDAFRKVLSAHAFTWLGIQSMFVYMIAYVQQNLPGLDAVQTGQVISKSFLVLSTVAAILPVIVLEPMAKRIGRVAVHKYCIASMAVGYLILSQVGSSTLLIYALMAFLGVGWASTISLAFAIMSQTVNASKMGLYMGLFNLSVVLPQLVSSVGVGRVINELDDKNGLFIICGISLALSAVAWSRVPAEQSQDEAKDTGVAAAAPH